MKLYHHSRVAALAMIVASLAACSDAWSEGPIEPHTRLDRNGDGFISAFEVLSFGPREPGPFDCAILDASPSARDVTTWKLVHEDWSDSLAQRFLDECEQKPWLR